jgi:hypothetical protein
MKRPTRVLAWTLALAFSTATQAQAQRLAVGDRARIVLPEEQRQSETFRPGELVLRGSVVRLAHDSVYIRPSGAAGALGIPLSSAVSVDRSLGLRPRPQSALRVGVITAIQSGLLWAAIQPGMSSKPGFESRSQALAVGAGVGAVVGIAIGAFLPGERWQRVR